LAKDLLDSDPKLSDVEKKWQKLASDDAIARTKKALESKKHKVDVVENKEAALKLITSLPLKESSVFLVGSTTLQEIGLTSYFEEHREAAKRNIKFEILLAQSKGETGKAGELVREGLSADIVFSSVPALAESGELIVCCATGSRTGAFNYSAKRLVVVVGANKIVPNYETARKRMEEYALPLESARSRIAYAKLNVEGSAINFEATIHGGNPLADGRIYVIIVKEHLGY